MFKFFKKSQFEKINEIKAEFERLKDKTNAISINFIGIEGQINGLTVIEATDSESFQSKYFAGLLADTFHKIQNLSEDFIKSEIKMGIINFNSSALIYQPITSDILFSCLVPNEKDIKKIEDWVNKNIIKLRKIFSSDRV